MRAGSRTRPSIPPTDDNSRHKVISQPPLPKCPHEQVEHIGEMVLVLRVGIRETSTFFVFLREGLLYRHTIPILKSANAQITPYVGQHAGVSDNRRVCMVASNRGGRP